MKYMVRYRNRIDGAVRDEQGGAVELWAFWGARS